MHPSQIALALLPFSANGINGINVVLSNDDGWAEINIREFYSSLTSAGFNTIISAPAVDRSGTGSADAEPTTVGSGCEFHSCPPGSPPTGNNASMPRFNYVNSYPATSMRYGIQNLSAHFFSGSAPDLAVAGPNVGTNLGPTTQISGTVGAAVEAVKQGVPALAFSGASGSQTAWDAAVSPYETVYAALSTEVTCALTSANEGEEPYLPADVFLNVNFPAVSDSACAAPSDFKFVLSRLFPAIPLLTPDDVETCGSTRLPTEHDVVHASGGCYASISVANTAKLDATADEQAFVLRRLVGILSCLP